MCLSGLNVDESGDTFGFAFAGSSAVTAFFWFVAQNQEIWNVKTTLIPIHTQAGTPGALPIVPQVHCTFFYFAKDFKAALQLCPGAVGPQSPHVHHSSLLLLVKRTDRTEGRD